MPSLYANIASGNGTVPPNNNTSLYNANGVPQAINDGISVTGNIIAGGYISAAGNVSGGNIVTAGNVYGTNFFGNVQGNLLVPGSNTQVLFNLNGLAGANANLTFDQATNQLTVLGEITATQITTPALVVNSISSDDSSFVNIQDGLNVQGDITVLDTISATGNITGNYFVGNGSQLTGLPATYSNADVATFLANFGSNVISTTGNISAGNVSLTGNIYTAAGGNNPVVLGQVSAVYGNTANATGSTLSFSIPSAGTWTIDFTISATINKNSGGADFLTAGLFDSSNVQVGNTFFVISSTENTARLYDLTVSGSGQYIVTTTGAEIYTAQAITTAGITSSSSFGTFVKLDPAFAISNVSYTGNLNFAGNITANAGNVTASDYLVGNYLAVTNSATVGSLSATGNVTGSYILGNGSQLTGLPATYSNADVATFLANFGSNAISTTGTVTTGNIHTGLISASGNVTISGNLFSDDISSANVTVYGDTVITGNLTVQGNTTTINSNVVTTNDKTITVANNQSTGANIDGAGLEAGNAAVATWLYNALTQSWQSNIAITPVANVSLDLGVGNRYWNNLYAANAVVTTVSATGNITGNYILGNGSQLTGLSATYSNANVAAFMAAFGSNTISTTGTVTAGNVTASNIITNGVVTASGNIISAANIQGANLVTTGGAFITGGIAAGATIDSVTALSTAGLISAAGNITGGNIRTAGQITATGTITAGNILIPAGGGLATDTISSPSGDFVTIEGVIAGAGIQSTGNAVFFDQKGIQFREAAVNGNSAVILRAPAALSTDFTFQLPDGYGSNAQLLTTDGTGNLSWSTAGGSPAGTNLQFQYNNSNVFGGVPGTAFYTGNGVIEIASTKFEAGAGPSSQITVPGSAGYVSVTGNVIAGNVNTTGLITATGNITGGNVRTVGLVSATGNITGNYIIGNGSQLTGVTAAAGGSANTIQFNNGGVLGGISDSFHYTANGITEISKVQFSSTLAGGGSGELFVPGTVGYVSVVGNVIAGNIRTAGTVSATGNITGNYFLGNGSQLTGITASAGGSNTQLQFNNANALAGNAAMTFDVSSGNVTLGNIRFNNNVIVNINSFQSNTNPNPGRILVGTGRNGNYAGLGTFGNNGTSARLFVQDEIFKYDDGLRTGMVVGSLYANLSGGNIGTANSNSRLTAVQGEVYVLSGNAVSTITGVYRGASFALNLGNSANTSNAFVSNGTVVATFIGVNAGSSANTMIGTNFATSLNGAVANLLGYSFAVGGSANVTGNVAGFFMANTTSQYALSNGNIARNVTNYHAFRNDDDLARSRLGMLERFHELNANTANTTGTVDIDKNSGQVQTIYPTGNVTIGTFSNFVTRVQKPDSTYVNAADTVTLVINQGATPYTVTMPTGNTQIRYASGISTVASTANTTVMISITGTYNYTTAANQYQITISPEFS